jgi:hypothetical protein
MGQSWAYLKIVSGNLAGETEENYVKPGSGQPVPLSKVRICYLPPTGLGRFRNTTTLGEFARND